MRTSCSKWRNRLGLAPISHLQRANPRGCCLLSSDNLGPAGSGIQGRCAQSHVPARTFLFCLLALSAPSHLTCTCLHHRAGSKTSSRRSPAPTCTWCWSAWTAISAPTWRPAAGKPPASPSPSPSSRYSSCWAGSGWWGGAAPVPVPVKGPGRALGLHASLSGTSRGALEERDAALGPLTYRTTTSL